MVRPYRTVLRTIGMEYGSVVQDSTAYGTAAVGETEYALVWSVPVLYRTESRLLLPYRIVVYATKYGTGGSVSYEALCGSRCRSLTVRSGGMNGNFLASPLGSRTLPKMLLSSVPQVPLFFDGFRFHLEGTHALRSSGSGTWGTIRLSSIAAKNHQNRTVVQSLRTGPYWVALQNIHILIVEKIEMDTRRRKYLPDKTKGCLLFHSHIDVAKSRC